MRRLALAASATLWALLLIVAYLMLPGLVGWEQPGWWYGFGWIAAVVLWALPVGIVAAE